MPAASRVWLVALQPLYVALGLPVGLVAGFVGTLLGIGGGAIMVPVMVLLGVPVSVAAPASLVAILGTSAGGLRRLFRRGLVDWRLAAFLETASGLGAALGVYLQGMLPEWVLRLLLGVVLLASAAGMVLQGRLGNSEGAGGGAGLVKVSVPRLAAAWAVSLLAGIVSALLGVGGGIIKVPVLVFVVGLPLRVALSTSKLMVGITASVGVVGYAVGGRIYWPLAISLLAGTYLGATGASRLLVSLREKVLRVIAASYYVVMGFVLVLRSRPG